MTALKNKPKKIYWYETIVWMCPVCGSEQKFRERVYNVKPEPSYRIEDYYDWCLERASI